MVAYTIRRILWILPVMLAIATITFLLMHLVPGGPWDSQKQPSATSIENLNRRYGLDDPLWKQYWTFVSGVFQADLGVSYTYRDRSVRDIIFQGLPATATLAAISFAIALVAGISLGMLAAIKRNTIFDYMSVSISIGLASIPAFVLGIMMIVLFSVRWHLLPTSGWGTPSHVVMPALALSVLPTALIARITRASMLEIIRQEFVQTARAKGLAPLTIYLRHVLKNALIPLLTVLGPELAGLLAGSFIVETVFSVPGIGRLFVDGVSDRDYGLIMGAVVFYGFLITGLNLVVDLLYAMVDPRIRIAQ